MSQTSRNPQSPFRTLLPPDREPLKRTSRLEKNYSEGSRYGNKNVFLLFMEMKRFGYPGKSFGHGDLFRNNISKRITFPDFCKPASRIGMNLEGRPNRTECGEALPWSSHDVAVRYNFDWIHEKES